jgi:hypothetical protein
MKYELFINHIINLVDEEETDLNKKRIAFIFNGLEDSLYYDTFCDNLMNILINRFNNFSI